MLIQSTNNMAQTSLSGKISSNGLANDGKPIIISTPSSGSSVQPGVSPDLPLVGIVQTAEQQATLKAARYSFFIRQTRARKKPPCARPCSASVRE